MHTTRTLLGIPLLLALLGLLGGLAPTASAAATRQAGQPSAPVQHPATDPSSPPAGTQTMPPEPVAPDFQATTETAVWLQETLRLTRQLEEVSDQIQEQAASLEDLRSNLKRFSLLGTLTLTVAGIVGWALIKRRVVGFVDQALEGIASKRLEEAVTGLRRELLDRTESDLIRFARILALVDAGKPEAALTTYGWEGNVAALRQEEGNLRRAVIESLYYAAGRTEKETNDNRESAWRAVQELAEESHEVDDLRLYLRLATKLGRYEEALEVVQRDRGLLARDLETATRGATILRRLGKRREALDVLGELESTENLAVIVTRAALHRDLGNYQEAHSVLLPAVTEVLEAKPSRLEDSESRLINTFVANCLDRGNPEDAVGAAAFAVVRIARPRPIEISTVGRLLLALPAGHGSRKELFADYSRRVQELPEGEVRAQSEVHLMRLEGKDDEAQVYLRRKLEELAAKEEASEVDRRSEYFYRCLLGELLLTRGAVDEAHAILLPAARERQNGEGCYLIAKAELGRGDETAAAHWLSEAIDILPKWKHLANRDSAMRRSSRIAEVLSTADNLL